MMEKLWGICPLNFRESRNSYWTKVKTCKNIDRTFDRTRSPLMQGGLEIPCNMAFAMDIRTKGQQEVLDRYKELVHSFYFEPLDGEDIVGSFQKKDQDALPAQVVPRKHKSEPEKRSSKDEYGLKDIRFFTCTTRKIKKKF